MALKTKVLINQINNLSDARYCAGMGVDYLGFILQEGKSNYLSPEQFQELTSWVSGPIFVGEFENSELDTIINISSSYSINTIQTSNNKIVKELFDLDYSVILELDAQNSSEAILGSNAPYVSAFLIKTESGNEEEFRNLSQLADQYPVIFGGNVSLENIDSLLDHPFFGIAMQGGDEVKPGYREFDEMADILEHLEIED